MKYMSLNQLQKYRSSRRDDLEQLAYTLIHIAKGELPWSSRKKKSLQQWLAEKNETQVDDLCAGLPAVYENFLMYSQRLGFTVVPNYSYWISQFKLINGGL